MKDAPVYPWRTKTQNSIDKAQTLHDRLSKMPETKEIEIDRWSLRIRICELKKIEQAFWEVDQLHEKYK